MEKNLPKTFFHFLLRLYLSFARKFFYLVNFISGLPPYYSTPHALLFPEKKYICLTNCTPLKVLHKKLLGPYFPHFLSAFFLLKNRRNLFLAVSYGTRRIFLFLFLGGKPLDVCPRLASKLTGQFLFSVKLIEIPRDFLGDILPFFCPKISSILVTIALFCHSPPFFPGGGGKLKDLRFPLFSLLLFFADVIIGNAFTDTLKEKRLGKGKGNKKL